MIKKIVFSGFIMLSLAKISLAQDKVAKSKWAFFDRTQVGFHTGLYHDERITGQNDRGGSIVTQTEFNHTGFSLRNELGFIYNRKLSLALGLGLENYSFSKSNWANYSFMPIYADARYTFSNEDDEGFYVGLSYGYSLRINSPGKNGGFTYTPKVGYQFLIGNLKSNVFLGYTQQSIKVQDPQNYIFTPKIRSLNFGFGVQW